MAKKTLRSSQDSNLDPLNSGQMLLPTKPLKLWHQSLRHVKIRHLVITFAWFSSFPYKEWQRPSSPLLVQYERHPLNATPLNQLLNHDAGRTHKVCTKKS